MGGVQNQVTTRPTFTTGFARVRGTFRDPYLELSFSPRLPHPTISGTTMLDWVRSLGSSVWDPGISKWRVYGIGSFQPLRTLSEAGIELDWDQREGELSAVPTLDDLVWPISKLAENGRTVFVRPRLLGRLKTAELLGPGCVWDSDRSLFRIYVADVLRAGVPRPGIIWQDDAIERARAAHAVVTVPEHLARLGRYLGNALNIDGVPAEDLAEIGQLPTFERPLFAYQVAGAYAVAVGRTCLFDEPGLGKSFQALAAARILRARRTLIVCPPLLTSNWAKEARIAGIDPNPTVISPTRKEPPFPDTGVLVVGDSLLAARSELAARVAAWSCDVMIYDEAHRMMTIGSARSEAVLNVGTTAKHPPIAVTGTPMFAAPHQLVPLLELTRVLAPVFGGRAPFLDDFCRADRYGEWHAKMAALPRLNAMMRDHVWVRRKKLEALPQLPPKIRWAFPVQVPLAQYHAAHKDVIAKVHAWMTWYFEHHHRPADTLALEDYARNASFELISQLRRAAGLAKVPAAIEWTTAHIEQTGFDDVPGKGREYRRPLLAWVHHVDVAGALMNAIPPSLGRVAAIMGDTSDSVRDAHVADFQDGKIAVMVASITKASVGLTLTRSSDALFVETDWTPARVKQAEDRTNRIGQELPTTNTTLVAMGTLDEPIQRVLEAKTKVAEVALGDLDDSVAVMRGQELAGLMDIALELVDAAARTWKPPSQGRGKAA